jgi:hypothetical protein
VYLLEQKVEVLYVCCLLHSYDGIVVLTVDGITKPLTLT